MNFLEAFAAWIGRTEAPPAFVEWGALSLLAAACGNRWYVPYRYGNDDVHLYPNLYVMLLGPSLSHKSFVISRVKEILDGVRALEQDRIRAKAQERGVDEEEAIRTRWHPRLHVFKGHITHSGIYDALRTIRRKRMPDGTMATVEMPWAGQFYLLQDELAACLGSPELAEQIIRTLTAMWRDDEFQDATRTHGLVSLHDFIINWLSGTTLEWFVGAINPNTINAGFFRRTCIITTDTLMPRVYPFSRNRPRGWEHLFDALVARVDYLIARGGPVKLDAAAFEVDEKWYMSLPAPPQDEHGIALHGARHGLSLKLALLLALANNEERISAERLAEAQDRTNDLVKMQAGVIPLIRKGTVGTPAEGILAFLLAREGGVSHMRLAKFAYEKFAVEARRLDDMLRSWMESGLITARRTNGQTYYRKDA